VTETEHPWSLVAESDQVYSAKTQKWYEVRSTTLLDSGLVRVRFTGVAKPFEVPAGARVRVRRGPTGEAVDVINTIMRSG
jgi:hypothetical protein